MGPRIDLPDVVKLVGSSAENLPFYGCTALREIHFAAANEAAVKESVAYRVNPNLGAANARIVFDL